MEWADMRFSLTLLFAIASIILSIAATLYKR